MTDDEILEKLNKEIGDTLTELGCDMLSDIPAPAAEPQPQDEVLARQYAKNVNWLALAEAEIDREPIKAGYPTPWLGFYKQCLMNMAKLEKMLGIKAQNPPEEIEDLL